MRDNGTLPDESVFARLDVEVLPEIALQSALRNEDQVGLFTGTHLLLATANRTASKNSRSTR